MLTYMYIYFFSLFQRARFFESVTNSRPSPSLLLLPFKPQSSSRPLPDLIRFPPLFFSTQGIGSFDVFFPEFFGVVMNLFRDLVVVYRWGFSRFVGFPTIAGLFLDSLLMQWCWLWSHALGWSAHAIMIACGIDLLLVCALCDLICCNWHGWDVLCFGIIGGDESRGGGEELRGGSQAECGFEFFVFGREFDCYLEVARCLQTGH